MNLSVTDSSTEEDDSWIFSDLIVIIVLIKKYHISFLELCWGFYSLLHEQEKSALQWTIIFQRTWQLLLCLAPEVLFIKVMSSIQGGWMESMGHYAESWMFL